MEKKQQEWEFTNCCSSEPTWFNSTQTLTHLLTTQSTTTPSLYSQLFVAANTNDNCGHISRFDYFPPLFICSRHRWSTQKFSASLFIDRVLRLGLPRSSWRSTCPFQIPPPHVVSTALVPSVPDQWGPQERREWVRRRLRRPRLGIKVPAVVAVALPNIALLALLLFDPLWLRPRSDLL